MIQRPVAHVFSYVADIRTHPKWEHGCMEVSYFTLEPAGIGMKYVGTKYRRTEKIFIFKFKATGEVTEYQPSRKLTVSIDQPTTGKVTFSFEKADGSTRVHALYEVRMQGLFRLFEPLLASMLRRAVRKSMANLKRILEASSR